MERGQGLSRPENRSSALIGLLVGVAYVLAYLYSIQNIVVAPGVDLAAGASVPSAAVVSDWRAKVWKPIAPFVWEPVVAVYPLQSVAVFLSVPNLLVALSLGALVGLNASVAVARVRAVRTGDRLDGSAKGLLASVPGLLTGFTCCVPTAVLALGSLAASFTVAVIAVRPYFIPTAALALIANLLWNARRLRGEARAAPAGRAVSNIQATAGDRR